MRIIKERKWGDNPSPFYTRINWPIAIVFVALASVIVGVGL